MMKFYVVFGLCFVLPSVMCISEEMKELAATLHKTCVEETGLDEAVITQVNSEKVLPDNDLLKCYLKCIMSQTGAMDDDGIIDTEALVTMMPEEYQEKTGPIIIACGTKVGANPCDNAWLTHQCYLESGKELYVLI